MLHLSRSTCGPCTCRTCISRCWRYRSGSNHRSTCGSRSRPCLRFDRHRKSHGGTRRAQLVFSRGTRSRQGDHLRSFVLQWLVVTRVIDPPVILRSQASVLFKMCEIDPQWSCKRRGAKQDRLNSIFLSMRCRDARVSGSHPAVKMESRTHG